ncbi:MAG: hypothetical protein B7X59_04225, partial [Polaromonas sp. 39-63-203]
EIDRLSAQTDFNGVKVLNSSQSLTIQVGAKDNEAISIALQKMDSGALNMRTFSVSGPDAAGQVSTAATVAAFLGKTVSATPAVAITIAAGSTGVADLGTVAPTAVVSMDSKGNYFAEVTAAAGTTRAGVVAGDKLYVAIDPASVTYTTGAPDTAVAAVVDFSAAGFAKSANALATVDAALAKVDTQRGALGAVQNRFDSVISNLGKQAGTSVLAQANQTTQGVLSLLR